MVTTLRRQAATGLRVLIVFTVLAGIAYPLADLGGDPAPGPLRARRGLGRHRSRRHARRVVADRDRPGGRPAADPYFHTRPSASAKDVLGPADTSTSGGSNKGTFDQKLLDTINQRKQQIAAAGGRAGIRRARRRGDGVGSGLDPDISPAYAALQVARVARVTGSARVAGAGAGGAGDRRAGPGLPRRADRQRHRR